MPSPGRSSGPGNRAGDPAAAAAIWRWRRSAGGESGSGSAGKTAARKEGAIRGLIGGAVGLLVFLFWHSVLAFVVWTIAGATLLLALVSPTGAYRWIRKGASWLALVIGALLGWILLPVFFFGFCLVFGLLARRGKRDRLERWFDEDIPSYWKERRDPPRDAAFYERQF